MLKWASIRVWIGARLNPNGKCRFNQHNETAGDAEGLGTTDGTDFTDQKKKFIGICVSPQSQNL